MSSEAASCRYEMPMTHPFCQFEQPTSCKFCTCFKLVQSSSMTKMRTKLKSLMVGRSFFSPSLGKCRFLQHLRPKRVVTCTCCWHAGDWLKGLIAHPAGAGLFSQAAATLPGSQHFVPISHHVDPTMQNVHSQNASQVPLATLVWQRHKQCSSLLTDSRGFLEKCPTWKTTRAIKKSSKITSEAIWVLKSLADGIGLFLCCKHEWSVCVEQMEQKLHCISFPYFCSPWFWTAKFTSEYRGAALNQLFSRPTESHAIAANQRLWFKSLVANHYTSDFKCFSLLKAPATQGGHEVLSLPCGSGVEVP